MPETKRFPATRINALRKRAAEAAAPPDALPDSWSISPVDPAGILAVFKTLRLKPHYRLAAYQFSQGGNGNGFVWAIPADATLPPPEQCPRLEGHLLDPPRPPDALDDVMAAIDGDGSAWSYLSASILGRELAEFGAMWHGCSWSTHTILGQDPWSTGTANAGADFEGPQGDPAEWTWEQPKPEHWEPSVSMTEDVVTVTFHTYSGYDLEAIYRHVDAFDPGEYRFRTDCQRIATGSAGFVF